MIGKERSGWARNERALEGEKEKKGKAIMKSLIWVLKLQPIQSSLELGRIVYQYGLMDSWKHEQGSHCAIYWLIHVH